jgi:hypothetical protein
MISEDDGRFPIDQACPEQLGNMPDEMIEGEGLMTAQDLAIYIMAATSVVDLFLTLVEKLT